MLAPVSAVAAEAGAAPTRATAVGFVDRQICVGCHQHEYQAWRGSHHDLAMQVASDETVLADFGDTTFSYFGVTSRFFKRNGKFFVNTDGPDGELGDFEIKYTFGVELLQQYLVQLPRGRLQSLTIAWDVEKKRWFHLYPDEKITHEDPLHWTGLYQNWNMMCAECHSTNLRKNYDAASDSYQTIWSEIDVSCQACHGAGLGHVEWAEKREQRAVSAEDPLKGFNVRLSEPEPGIWKLNSSTLKYERSPALTSEVQLETCAPCHARRHVIDDNHEPGRPLLDSYVPALLREPLYFVDGQIRDEVYVYGSFVQSKMFHKGVRCSDCHEPHSLKLRYPQDNVCISCHLSNIYDSPKHHFHQPGSAGARCVECHMPTRTYMGVDPRRDHSIRIPRPDLSAKLGTPNACSGCHDHRSAKWAAEAAARWWGTPQEHHYGEILANGRAGSGEAAAELSALANSEFQPAIVRATALETLEAYGPAGREAMMMASQDKNPLLRVAAVRGLRRDPATERVANLARLLADPVRAVRVESARALVSAPLRLFDRPTLRRLDSAIAEYQRAQELMSDTPAAHLNLAVLYEVRGEVDHAERSYLRAIRIDPSFLPARFNLANFLNRNSRNAEAERVLREGLIWAPENGELHYSLGLLLAEEQQWEKAVASLSDAVRLMPERARVRYNYALTLQRFGKPDKALEQLRAAYQIDASDPAILQSLSGHYATIGDLENALLYTEKLIELLPEDPRPRQAAERLRAMLLPGAHPQ